MKNVYLVPGFLSSSLFRMSDGVTVWWDPNLLLTGGCNFLRLAPDGVSPGVPGGVAMDFSNTPPTPWDGVITALTAQLDQSVWSLLFFSYDWRLKIEPQGVLLANRIRADATPAEPATIVGHSMGGIIACLAWKELNSTGQANLVRRVISLGSPFQGSYGTIQWLTGQSGSVQQLLALGALVSPGLTFIAAQFLLPNLNSVALTWPAFYELFPGLGGTEEAIDPNRALLYDASNYPSSIAPSQAWLTYSRDVYQPIIRGMTSFPPPAVMTSIAGRGISTPYKLLASRIPLNLTSLDETADGDNTVTKGSAYRAFSQTGTVAAAHSSMAIDMATSGDLAQLILAERTPPPPPPADMTIGVPMPWVVNDPPDRSYVSPTTCVGGHC